MELDRSDTYHSPFLRPAPPPSEVAKMSARGPREKTLSPEEAKGLLNSESTNRSDESEENTIATVTSAPIKDHQDDQSYLDSLDENGKKKVRQNFRISYKYYVLIL